MDRPGDLLHRPAKGQLSLEATAWERAAAPCRSG
jgi:hypothetical protein